MAGYLNRFIDISCPDLGGVDDSGRAVIWVKIRNPRLMAGQELSGGTKVRFDNQGRPLETESAAVSEETFTMMSKLVIAGHVWDATWLPTNLDADDEEPPLLPMPPSPQDVAKMPMDLLTKIAEEMHKANPKSSPDPSTTTTSS